MVRLLIPVFLGLSVFTFKGATVLLTAITIRFWGLPIATDNFSQGQPIVTNHSESVRPSKTL
jgi:hypothetical protein